MTINSNPTYGQLTPIAYLHKDGHHKSIWRFSCSCGNEKICRLSDVKSGRIQSCGCLQALTRILNGFLRTIDIEGTELKEFQVLKRNTDKSFKSYYAAFYTCKCKCGEIFERRGKSIISGQTKRCGKCQKLHNANVTAKIRKSKKQMSLKL